VPQTVQNADAEWDKECCWSWSYKKKDAEERENGSHPGNHFLFEPFFAGATRRRGATETRRSSRIAPKCLSSSLPGVHCASLLRVFFSPTATRRPDGGWERVLCRSWRRVRTYTIGVHYMCFRILFLSSTCCVMPMPLCPLRHSSNGLANFQYLLVAVSNGG
jgi:hypothetical protein